MKKDNLFGIKLVATITFLAMILANVAAILLPVNGLTTQEVSDKYANLFAPAEITFSIWAIIYLFVAGLTVYFWLDLSVVIMLVLLITLIIISVETGKYRFNTKKYIFVRLLFNIYFC